MIPTLKTKKKFLLREARRKFVLTALLFLAKEGRDTHGYPELQLRQEGQDTHGYPELQLRQEGRDTHGYPELQLRQEEWESTTREVGKHTTTRKEGGRDWTKI